MKADYQVIITKDTVSEGVTTFSYWTSQPFDQVKDLAYNIFMFGEDISAVRIENEAGEVIYPQHGLPLR